MAAHHSRGSWAVGALLWTLICVAIGIAFEGIGWLVKFVGGTGNLFGWLVFVVLGLVGIVAIVLGLVSLMTDGMDVAPTFLIGGAIVTGLAWVVANFWLRLSWISLGHLAGLLKPQQWMWGFVTIAGPLLAFKLVSSLPLAWFEPPHSLAGKQCGKCGKPVPLQARSGERCPYCGAYWSFESTRQNFDPAASRRTWALVVACIALVVALAFVVNHW